MERLPYYAELWILVIESTDVPTLLNLRLTNRATRDLIVRFESTIALKVARNEDPQYFARLLNHTRAVRSKLPVGVTLLKRAWRGYRTYHLAHRLVGLIPEKPSNEWFCRIQEDEDLNYFTMRLENGISVAWDLFDIHRVATDEIERNVYQRARRTNKRGRIAASRDLQTLLQGYQTQYVESLGTRDLWDYRMFHILRCSLLPEFEVHVLGLYGASPCHSQYMDNKEMVAAALWQDYFLVNAGPNFTFQLFGAASDPEGNLSLHGRAMPCRFASKKALTRVSEAWVDLKLTPGGTVIRKHQAATARAVLSVFDTRVRGILSTKAGPCEWDNDILHEFRRSLLIGKENFDMRYGTGAWPHQDFENKLASNWICNIWYMPRYHRCRVSWIPSRSI